MPTVRGGEKLRRALRKGQFHAGDVRIRVGFFKSAKYPDGVFVASVAAWQEYGTEKNGKLHIPIAALHAPGDAACEGRRAQADPG